MRETIQLVLLLSLGANIGFAIDVEQYQENDELGFLQTILDVKSGSNNLQLDADINNLEQETHAQSNDTAILQQEHKFWNRPRCMKNTGGTCLVNDCDARHGPSNCSMGVCECQEGYCSGGNGQCYEGPYKLLLDNFTIQNYRYGDYYMYAKRRRNDNHSLALRVQRGNRTRKCRFALYEMPDGSVVMTSKRKPGFAVTFVESKQDPFSLVQEDVDLQKSDRRVRTQASTSQKHYIAELKEVDGSPVDAQRIPQSADYYALRLFAPPGGISQLESTGALMIGAYRYPRYYVDFPRYAWHQKTYDLDVEQNDQGDGSLWVFDPPLPMTFPLRPFEGRTCNFDCTENDTFDSGLFGGGTWWTYIFLGLVAFLLSIVVFWNSSKE